MPRWQKQLARGSLEGVRPAGCRQALNGCVLRESVRSCALGVRSSIPVSPCVAELVTRSHSAPLRALASSYGSRIERRQSRRSVPAQLIDRGEPVVIEVEPQAARQSQAVLVHVGQTAAALDDLEL